MGKGLQVISHIDDQIYDQLDELEGVTLYHGRRWHRLLERTFGWRVKALVDHNRDGDVALFLPFVEKRRLGRKIRVSLPLSHRIGAAIRSGYLFAFPDWLAPFEAHAEVPGLTPMCHHVVTELDLSRFRGPEELLASFDLKSVRQRLRRAEKSRLTVTVSNQPEAFQVFTGLQAETRRRQGAPTYPADFFPVMCEEIGPISRVHVTVHEGCGVAGVIFIHYRGIALYGYGADATDSSLRNNGANQLALWSAIRDALQAGCKFIDFGSSPVHQESLWRYKERWGGVTRPLVHSSLGIVPVAQGGALSHVGGAVLKRLPLPVFEMLSPSLLRAVL